MPSLAPALDDPACYLALCARDARFDGRFFTGVASTGIYCRPVCRVKSPKAANCRFFQHAAQAEQAGFRPCLRCRPELAPAMPGLWAWSIQDALAHLAWQAARLLDAWPTHSTRPSPLEDVARRLGVSGRHLRRLFETHLGISPHQYWQTRRLLLAKQLLTDTRLPLQTVARYSGSGSSRSLHTAFHQRYGLRTCSKSVRGHACGFSGGMARRKTPSGWCPTRLCNAASTPKNHLPLGLGRNRAIAPQRL